MASLTQRTWLWARSGSWWWTGKPGMLQSMGSQIVRDNWVTELTELMSFLTQFLDWAPWDQRLDLIHLFISSIQKNIVGTQRCFGKKWGNKSTLSSSYLDKGEAHLGAMVSCRSTVQWMYRTPVKPSGNTGIASPTFRPLPFFFSFLPNGASQATMGQVHDIAGTKNFSWYFLLIIE